MSRYLERIINRFRAQEAKGINKYGQALEDNQGDIQYRLEHLAQELSDGLMYVEWIKERETDIAALTEENDIQRASIQQLSAQVVSLQDDNDSLKKEKRLLINDQRERITEGNNLRMQVVKMQEVVDAAKEVQEAERLVRETQFVCKSGVKMMAQTCLDSCKIRLRVAIAEQEASL